LTRGKNKGEKEREGGMEFCCEKKGKGTKEIKIRIRIK